MQLKYVFTAAILYFAVFTSCKKENAPVKPTAAIEGKWVGKSSVLSEPFTSFYSFNIKAGNVLERLDANGVMIGTGTWETYNAEEGFTGTYKLTGGATFSVIANFDNINGKLDGTWGNGTKEYGGGYWFMNKIN
jgi:hypothetical protein